MPAMDRWRGVLALLLVMAGPGAAQQQPPLDEDAFPAELAQPAGADVPTLGEVRAVAPDEAPPLDLYRFRNPIPPDPNRFDQAWQPPPSQEQIGMRGGYVMLGLYYAIAKTAQGLHTLTRAPDPIQPAIARPPPLSEAQMARAAALSAAERAGGSE